MTHAGGTGDEPELDTTHHNRRLGVSSLLNLVGFAVYGLANLALITVLSRQLGATGAGELLTAIAVFNIVTRSSMIGTDVALVRFTARFLATDRHDRVGGLYRTALGPVLLVSGVAGLLMFALAGPLGQLLTSDTSSQDLTRYLQVLAPFVPIACVYQVIEGGSRGFGTMLPGVVVERLGRSIALPLILLAVIAAGGGTIAIALAWAGPFALALIPMGLWTHSLLRRAEQGLLSRRSADPAQRPAVPPGEMNRRFWNFALPRSLASVFALTIVWVDSLLLGALEGPAAVGVYAAATRWLLVGNFAGNAVTTALGPQISSVFATDGARGARRLFQDATAWFVLLAWPTYLAAMVFAPVLVGLFGEEFESGTTVLVITGVGFLIASATGPIDMLLLMAGRSRLSLINTGIALAVNIGANLVLIPALGINGAALAWVLSLVVANGLPTIQMWRAHRIQPWGARSLRALALSGGAGIGLLAGRILLGPTLGGLIVGLVLGGAVLLAGVALSPDRLGLTDMLKGRATTPTTEEAPDVTYSESQSLEDAR